MNIKFDEVKIKRQVRVICTKCKKIKSRTVCEEQTINPWNVNDNGIPKTRKEVVDDVLKKIEKKIALVKSDFICASCEEKEMGI
jgi:hypothetical protein